MASEAPVALDPLTRESAAPAEFPVHPQVDVERALRGIPGLVLRGSGGLGAYTESSLRGSSGRQMALLLNGVPLLSPGEEALNLSLLPSFVLEAAAVDTQGHQSLVGDLQLRTRQDARAFSASLGSFGQWSSNAGLPLGDGQLAVQLREARNDFPIRNPLKPFDPSDPERRRPEPRQNAATAQRAALYTAPGWLALLVDNQEHIPNQRNSRNNQAQLHTRLLQLAGPAPVLDGSQWRLAWTDERFLDASAQLALESTDLKQRTASLGWDSLDWSQQQRWTIDLHQYRAEDDNRPEATLKVHRARLGWDWTPLSADSGRFWGAQLGAKLLSEWVDQGDTDLRLLPTASVWKRWSTDPASMQLGVSYRERAPTLFEKYGDRGLFRGNAELRPERALSVDIQKADHQHWPGFSLYSRWVSDAITPQYNARGLGRATNAGRAQIVGLNLHQRWGLLPWLALRARADWLEARDRSDGPFRNKRLPGRPEWVLDLGLDATHGRWAWGYAFRYEEGAFYDSPNLLQAPTVRLHDLSLSVALPAGLSLQFQALNLSDNRHARFNGFPEPGRQYRADFYLLFD